MCIYAYMYIVCIYTAYKPIQLYVYIYIYICRSAARSATLGPKGLPSFCLLLDRAAQDSSKGGAVETGCSGSHSMIGCVFI